MISNIPDTNKRFGNDSTNNDNDWGHYKFSLSLRLTVQHLAHWCNN